ncbi:hypothetical protein ACHAW5_002209 [Stephanodiscus triporus]|uniref:Uncharacterized protein n=1 Tax=Stephanodiscus triporus TaxID=2934178 RepID=A0ABD3P6A9_9STRA
MSDRGHDDRGRRHYDLNVPLPPSAASSSSSGGRQKRRHLARTCQARLHQLGYRAVAFTHTAYGGRPNVDRDDADVALPWSDLLSSSSDGDGNADRSGGEGRRTKFGRTNSHGMQVYRRLNVVIEEASDVSRILLPTSNIGSTASLSSSEAASMTQLLRKYDVVSLQPMNEPALQGICDLLMNRDASSSKTNVDVIDILVLEYATGSRGGYGLPYKLRKEYLEKALRAGVTFELCYGTAMIDMKRRQGFLRTLIDFQSSYNGIQKKHTILNSNPRQLFRHHRGQGGTDVAEKTKMDTKFPLLLSSGSRQDYTRGTDEGTLALRTPQDINFFVRHLVGGAMGGDCVEVIDGVVGTRPNKKAVVVASAAERALARSRDRAMGVVVVAAATPLRGNKRLRRPGGGWETRSYVVGIANERLGNKDVAAEHDEDDGDDDEDENGKFSLIDWLSLSLNRTLKVENEDEVAAISASAIPPRIHLERTIKDDDAAADKPSSPSTDNGIQIQNTIGLVDRKEIRIDPNEDRAKDDDVEDGYIAI